MTKRKYISTAPSRAIWLMLAVLVPAVLLPAGCVLWFMNEAMQNEQLAVRQKLLDVYQGELAEVRQNLTTHWAKTSERLSAEDTGQPADDLFAEMVTRGLCDTVIIYDTNGHAAYPDTSQGEMDRVVLDASWAAAREMELAGDDAQAAAAYAALALTARDIHREALALQAQTRCFRKAGQTTQAMVPLAKLTSEAKYALARDSDGRLIVPPAVLLLMEMSDKSAREELANSLKRILTDYQKFPMPSSQRLFLMKQYQALAPGVHLPTLAAEQLAADLLVAPVTPSGAAGLTRSDVPGIWLLRLSDKRILAAFRDVNVTGTLSEWVEQKQALRNTAVVLHPAGEGKTTQRPLLTIPVGPSLPETELSLYLKGEDPFAAAARRHRTIYLWTGILGVLMIIAMAAIVAGYFARQMRLTRLKNDLIATVSHEIRTPLASMRVLTDTLLEGRCESESRAMEYFGLISKENDRLTRLIDNFLSFSRMERNKKSFEFVELSARDIISTAIASAGDRLHSNGCQLTVDVPDPLPQVVGDRDALITVLLNLLNNAWKYSGDEKRIAIHARADGAMLHLTVTDNGMGISRRNCRRIFSRFYQVDRSLTRNVGGCGLGLSIVKFIVDAHDGSVDVTSRLGEGSTFTVSLPTAGGSGNVG